MEEEILFSESQSFRQAWLWLLIMIITLLFIYMDVQQLVFAQAPGEKALDKGGLLICNTILLLVLAFFFTTKLETVVKRDGLYVRFFPFAPSLKKFSWEELSQVQIRQYYPMGEYGGWRLRFGFGNGKAYTVSGNKGIQLIFKNGSRLLIGTQKSEAAAEAFRRMGFGS